MSLYRQALEQAEAGGDEMQAAYHSINCAFMELAYGGDDDEAREFAARALRHGGSSGRSDVWRFATAGEAHIYLGDNTAALAEYARAIAESPRPWQAASMYQQAVRAADLMGEDALVRGLGVVFGYRS